MQGLRTQEDRKFENFFSIVQIAAKEKGCIFFGDSGEGNELIEPDMEGEDLFGWLIPEGQADDFEREFVAFKVSDKWESFQRFAHWKKNDEHIEISFSE